MLIRRVSVVVCSVVALVCTAPDSVGIARRTPSPLTGKSHTSARPPGTVAWRACPRPLVGVELECGRLDVALDRSAPNSRRISIALARLKARSDGPRRGVLVVNPGGPDGSGIEAVRNFATDRSYGRATSSFADHFDVVGFDRRGTGASSPVRCGVTRDDLGLNAFVDVTTTEGFGEMIVRWKESCRRISGDLLDHVGTIETAEDIDDIRVGLGETTVSYLGYSYGTLLGAVYATLFPARVDAMVLDAAVDPEAFGGRNIADEGRRLEGRLDRFLSECGSSPTCVFNNGTPPAERFSALVARLDASPIAPDLAHHLLSVGGRDIVRWTAPLLDDAASWPKLANFLRDIDAGNRYPYFFWIEGGAYGAVSDYLPPGPYMAIMCRDGFFPQESGQAAAIKAQLVAAAPRLWRAVVDRIDFCDGWPAAVRTLPPVLAVTTLPVLVIGSTDDPTTPYVWAQGLTRELGNASLLTRRGEGHTSAEIDICVNVAVRTYLEKRIIPTTGTQC